nr:ethylene-responsive transcription factor RAP2-7-like isoform X1 [Ipomoea batatas]
MLDLNLEAVPGSDSAEITVASAIVGGDSGTSVTASSSDESNTSSHTLAHGGCNSLCTLNFSILKSDADQAIEAEEDCNGDHSPITDQLVPVAGQSFPSTVEPPAPAPLSQSWLNLSVMESGCNSPRMPQPHQPAVKKPRRGPRSRSSQYRGVTFYRRTGRWESHIWDCGKQIYLGGFDTAHFAARAYDRAALKFRGVDADINFQISDYEEDMKQTKNLTKEEFIQTLRRQSTGFYKRTSRYRGVTLHKCGRWDAQIGQFLGDRTYDKEAIKCNQHRDAGGGNGLDPNHWISAPLGGLKGPDNTRKLEFNFGVCQTPVLKQVNVLFTNAYPSRISHDSSYIAVDSSPATPRAPAMESKYSIWTIPSMHHPGIVSNTQERAMGMRAEKPAAAPAFSDWQWKMQSQGVVTSSVPLYSSAASSGFSSTTTPLRHP